MPIADPTAAPHAPGAAEADLRGLEAWAGQACAWCVIAGLPALGIAGALLCRLPLFAALMGGCFLFAAALTAQKALAAFAGKTLRLLVTARLVVVLVLGALLFCVSGNAWAGLVSAVLLWLAADRLLGRHALLDLWRLYRRGAARGRRRARRDQASGFTQGDGHAA
jgi:hypothetical protein